MWLCCCVGATKAEALSVGDMMHRHIDRMALPEFRERLYRKLAERGVDEETVAVSYQGQRVFFAMNARQSNRQSQVQRIRLAAERDADRCDRAREKDARALVAERQERTEVVARWRKDGIDRGTEQYLLALLGWEA